MIKAENSSIRVGSKNRRPVHPPVVTLASLRRVAGFRIDDVLDRLEDEMGVRPGRGTISAIENGHRGASREMIQALELIYDLEPGALLTDYEPRGASQNLTAVS